LVTYSVNTSMRWDMDVRTVHYNRGMLEWCSMWVCTCLVIERTWSRSHLYTQVITLIVLSRREITLSGLISVPFFLTSRWLSNHYTVLLSDTSSHIISCKAHLGYESGPISTRKESEALIERTVEQYYLMECIRFLLQ